MPDDAQDKQWPDRPLECGECKKPIAVKYTEITDDGIVHTSMCSDCPELQRRLHGTHPQAIAEAQLGPQAALVCGNCGTTFEEIKRGHRLGCPECYTVFEDLLLIEMQVANRFPAKQAPSKKNPSIHIGRLRGEKLTINPSSRLIALNEALKEMLSREDYEEAALLRDQIKALTEQDNTANGKKEKKEKKGNGSNGSK